LHRNGRISVWANFVSWWVIRQFVTCFHTAFFWWPSSGHSVHLSSLFNPLSHSGSEFTSDPARSYHTIWCSSQKNRATLQNEQWSPGEWRQLRTSGVAKLAALYSCLSATWWWCRCLEVFPWPWRLQFSDGYCTAGYLSTKYAWFSRLVSSIRSQSNFFSILDWFPKYITLRTGVANKRIYLISVLKFCNVAVTVYQQNHSWMTALFFLIRKRAIECRHTGKCCRMPFKRNKDKLKTALTAIALACFYILKYLIF
jgi:hypothetical protein